MTATRIEDRCSETNSQQINLQYMDPRQYSRSKINCTAGCEIIFHLLVILKHIKHTKAPCDKKKRARSVTAVASEEGRFARWPGDQATTLDVRGGEATWGGASCYTQQRLYENVLFVFFSCAFPSSCLALARRKAMPCKRVSLRDAERPQITRPSRAQTCAVSKGKPFSCPAAENARKDPRPEETSRSMCH